MTRPNRRVNKQTRARLEEIQARGEVDKNQALLAQEAGGENSGDGLDEAEAGVRGALITSARYLRSDARIAAQLLTAGVVDEKVAKGLMQKTYLMLNAAIEAGKVRNSVALWKLVATWPKLEIDHRRAVGSFGPTAAPSPPPVSITINQTGSQTTQVLNCDRQSLINVLSAARRQGAEDAVFLPGVEQVEDTSDS